MTSKIGVHDHEIHWTLVSKRGYDGGKCGDDLPVHDCRYDGIGGSMLPQSGVNVGGLYRPGDPTVLSTFHLN